MHFALQGVAREVVVKGSRELRRRGATSHLERSSSEECDNRKLQKNTDAVYHRHNRMDWTAAQRARRDTFHDASWAESFTQSKIPEGAVHLIIGRKSRRIGKWES